MSNTQIDVVESAITIPGVRVTNVGLDIDEALSQDQMGLVLACLHRLTGIGNWMLGDALAFSGRKWGNNYAESKYEQANQITGLAIPTLKAAKFTAEHIPLVRRRSELTFTHHCEIAFAFDDPAIQDNWLDRAIAEKWSVPQLRKAIRLSKQEIFEEPNKEAGKYKPVEATTFLVDWLRKQDVSQWSDEQRDAWRGDLQPIVEFFNSL